MWFDQSKIEALVTALKTGQKEGIENILHDVLAVGTNPDPNIPTFCPRCGKPFVQKPLQYFLMGVKACPDGHGYWLSDDNARKIKLYFEQHLPTSGNRRNKVNSFRVFGFLVGIAVVIFNYYQAPRIMQHVQTDVNYKMTFSMPHPQNVSPKYWPTRDYSKWNVFPSHQNVINDPEELEYFQAWIEAVNDGIINRLNMNDALLAKRPIDEYVNTYYYFADRQDEVIYRLKNMYPPDRLREFHETVIDAMTSQVAFYEDYTRRKADEPSLQFSSLLQHEKLLDCDKKLWAAYHEFQRIYPSRDRATNDAIEQRLCWLDMI